MYYPMFCSMSPQRSTSSASCVPRSPGIIGFSNDSFNCYANAAIQALASCPPLIRLLKEDEKRESVADKVPDDKLPEKFRQIILDIWSENRNTLINPEELIETLRVKTKLFEKGIQHDTQEFLHFLMLLLKERKKTKRKMKSSKQHRDSGLGSLHNISHSSSIEEEEEEDEEEEQEEADEKDAKEKIQTDTHDVKGEDKEEEAKDLESQDSGLELELSEEEQGSDNFVSIFESVIEITTKCHSCNKESRVREVSETIRVPILSTSTKSDKKKTAQDPVIASQPAAVSDLSDTVLKVKPAVENVPTDSDSVAEKTSFEPSMGNLESNVSDADSEASSSVEASETPSDERSVKEEKGSGSVSTESQEEVQVDESSKTSSSEEEWSVLMQCVKSVWNFIGLAFCGPNASSAYEQMNEEKGANGGSHRRLPLTLDVCIDEMLEAETMDGDNRYNCETCKGLTNASRNVRLMNLSEVLIFHLMRFTFEKGKVNKVQDSVQFPPVIDMSKYLPASENENEKQKASYELVSVICHQGGSNGGHYTTFAKHDDSKLWHYFDDTRITQVSIEAVLKQQAYILFYRRI